MEETTMVETVETQPEVEAETTETAVGETVVEETQTAETETAPTPEASPIITVKYNKQMRSLSHDDAVNYAQKGMKYDSLSPILESLKYVAASEGKTLAEFVESIRTKHDENVMDALIDKCGGREDLAKELFEVEKGKHQSAYDNLIKAEKDAETESEESVTKRLADELVALREEFPDVKSYSDLPVPVIREAEEKGVSLLDSYLRYQHREQKKAAEAKAQQASAAKSSTGAQSSVGGNESVDPIIAALKQGIWGR
jgi:hypothetical protein